MYSRTAMINFIIDKSDLYRSNDFTTFSDERVKSIYDRYAIADRRDAKPRWFVRRALDGAMLGKNGKWYTMFADTGDFKWFKRAENAIKFGLKYEDGTAYAVHPGETIDVVGSIYNVDGRVRG